MFEADVFEVSMGTEVRPGVVELIEWQPDRRRFSCGGRARATLAPTLTVCMIERRDAGRCVSVGTGGLGQRENETASLSCQFQEVF